jgi:hypothetical protein
VTGFCEIKINIFGNQHRIYRERVGLPFPLFYGSVPPPQKELHSSPHAEQHYTNATFKKENKRSKPLLVESLVFT